jgi:hypothetical protein
VNFSIFLRIISNGFQIKFGLSLNSSQNCSNLRSEYFDSSF